MNNLNKLALTFTAAILISGCAATAGPEEQKVASFEEVLAQETQQDGRACVRQSDIDGYGTGNRDTLFIDAGREYYVATMRFSCFGLDTSIVAGFKGSFNEICGGRMDKIVTGGESCVIGEVYQFANREDAHAMVEMVEEKRKTMLQKAREKDKQTTNTK